MSYLRTHLYFKLANEIININKGNMRTKRKCITLNFLKTYHANIIENRPLLKFKFIFRSRIKRKRKRIVFFRRRYFTLKRLRNIRFLKKSFIRRNFNKGISRKKSTILNSKNGSIIKNILQNYRKYK